MSEEATRSDRCLEIGILVACLVTVAAVFLPTLGFDFVTWDDQLHVYENPMVVGGREVPFMERLRTPALGYPIPLTIFTYNIEHALFGLDPLPYHANNVLLHLLACFLVFAVGRRLGLGPAGAGIATILFGLHPMAAEPVSWVTGRKDLLAACLCLLATFDFLKHPFEVKKPRAWLAPVLFIAASLCKPVSFFLVPLLFAFHLFFHKKGVKEAAISIAPMAIFAAVLFPIALLGQEANDSLRPDHGVFDVLREAWYALGFHLGLLSFVHESSVKYLPTTWPPDFEPIVDLMPLVWLAALAGLSRLVPPDKRRIALGGLLWAALAYLPSSSLIPLTRFLADVYLYLPLAGLGWALGAIIDKRPLAELSSKGRAATLGGLAVTALLLAALTLPTSAKWRDSVTLWGSAYALYPHDMRLCRNIGNGYHKRQRPDLALAQYEACAKVFGREVFAKNIAVTLFRMGLVDEARAAFEDIERQRPGDPVVRKYLRRLGPPPSRDRGRPPGASGP